MPTLPEWEYCPRTEGLGTCNNTEVISLMTCTTLITVQAVLLKSSVLPVEALGSSHRSTT